MKCPKCNSEYEGDFCPKCNNLPSLEQENGSNKKSSKLLGFRTNTIWKKVLSILYLIFCFLYLISVIFTEKYVNITNYDFIISQICDFLVFVIMISPYIFLSNTKFRDKLPLFKKHTKGASLAGLLIITVIIGIASGFLEEAHSKEFLADRENHAYKETVTEATCEKAGEIKNFCEYCGLTETETINALGHKMEEVSRKDATETENGEIVKRCSVCGKEEKTVLEKLKSTASKTESSENESKNESKPNAASSKDTSSKINSSKVNSSKESSSKSTSSQQSTIELTDCIGKTLQDMSNKFKIDFVEVNDNDYIYAGKGDSACFEVYTKKTGGITAIKLVSSGEKYTLCGLKNTSKADTADKILKAKGFKSIGDNKWVSKSNKDIIMLVGNNWVYEKDSPLVSEEALMAKAEEEFVPKYDDSVASVYLGNGQIIELLSDSLSEFSYQFSQKTDYQKAEYINKINGRYIRVHGKITSVSSVGTVVVFDDDYMQKNNMWLSGTASASVKLITQQIDMLAGLNKSDEVILYARINADTYDKTWGTIQFDLYDGILYSIGNNKIDIPFINESIDGIYQYIPTDYELGVSFGEE